MFVGVLVGVILGVGGGSVGVTVGVGVRVGVDVTVIVGVGVIPLGVNELIEQDGIDEDPATEIDGMVLTSVTVYGNEVDIEYKLDVKASIT